MRHDPLQAFEFREDEIRFVFSRSSGPGGQNVNKVNTRVTLLFSLSESRQFTDAEKNRIRHALRRYLDKDGCIQIHSRQHRSQWANRNAALKRLKAIIDKALRVQKVRKKTTIPRRAVEKRLQVKKRRSQLKKFRSGPADTD